MRFVVYGAGAVGGVIGARLFQHGHDVTLIARGAHREAMRSRGLRLDTPDESLTLRVPVADRPGGSSYQSLSRQSVAMMSRAAASVMVPAQTFFFRAFSTVSLSAAVLPPASNLGSGHRFPGSRGAPPSSSGIRCCPVLRRGASDDAVDVWFLRSFGVSWALFGVVL